MEDEFQYKGVKQAPFALLTDSTTLKPLHHPFKREQNTFLKLDNYLY